MNRGDGELLIVLSYMRFVGQVVNLRGGWLPPLFRANAAGTLWVWPIGNRPQLGKLPH
jgi:hypothetical protein